MKPATGAHPAKRTAVWLFIVSTTVLLVGYLVSELDFRYNILRFDSNDVLGNVVYYGIMASVYVAVFSVLLFLFGVAKTRSYQFK